MKKLFIALMAVCVLVSCGDKKEEKSKGPADLMTMSTALLNQVADNVEKATNADQVIDAVEVFVNGTINLYNNHAADFKAIDEKYTEEELAEKFPNESAAMEKASNRMGGCMENAMQRCEFTQEQQERLMTVLMKMAELDI